VTILTTEEKLKHFEESSMEKARLQSMELIETHKEALAKLENEHKAGKDRQAALQIKMETESLKRTNNMTLSKEQIKIRRKIIKVHNELKEKLFVEVKAMLEEYMDTPAYEQLLIRQIQEALDTAGSDQVIIYIDPADVTKQSSLSAATQATLTVSEYSFMGGTRAVIPDRHILIDNSFAAKLEEAKAEFKFDGGFSHE